MSRITLTMLPLFYAVHPSFGYLHRDWYVAGPGQQTWIHDYAYAAKFDSVEDARDVLLEEINCEVASIFPVPGDNA
jgi:hypothetical protein